MFLSFSKTEKPSPLSRYATLLADQSFERQSTCEAQLSTTHAIGIIPGFLVPVTFMEPMRCRCALSRIPTSVFDLGLRSTLPMGTIMSMLAGWLQGIRRRYPSLQRLDFIGYSMGGVLAIEAIAMGLLDGLRVRIVTMGAPHLGVTIAYLGLLIPGALALSPLYRWYRQYAYSPRLEGIPFLSLAGERDLLVPPASCRHPQAQYQVLPRIGHGDFLLQEEPIGIALDFFTR